MDSQHALVAKQFGSNAGLYATSSTHNDADALQHLLEIIRPTSHDEALDIATGPGTLALLVAPLVRRSVAFDLTPSMLEQVVLRAKEQGVANVETVQGTAEDLPFEDDSFDLVMVRTAPHHYADVQKAIDEMARVVRPTGRVLVVDTCSPEDPEADDALNTLEKLRDPSHVRNYTPSEWRSMMKRAGLAIELDEVHLHARGKRLTFNAWVERMGVEPTVQRTLWRMLEEASPALREAMEIELLGSDISFTLPEITLLARPSP